MKRVLSITLALLLTVTMFSSVVMANPELDIPIKIIKKDVITDKDILLERAKKGVTDVRLPFQYGKLENHKTKQLVALDVLSTTQLAKEVYYKSGKVQKSYVTTNFVAIPTDSLVSDQENNAIESNKVSIQSVAQQRYAYDSSISVKAVSTIWWSYANGGYDYVDMDSVDGSWTIQDDRVGISSRHVRAGQIDNNYDQIKDWYPTSNSFYYSVSSWQPVRNIGLNTVGATTTAYLYSVQNPSDTWTLTLTNNLPLPVSP